MPFAVVPYVVWSSWGGYAVRARPRGGARTAYARVGGASGAELALDLRVEDLLALGVEGLEDRRDVLAGHDLVEALADAGTAARQQDACVVLRAGLGQLL